MGLVLGGLGGRRPLDSAFLRSWVGDSSPQGQGQRALNPWGQDVMHSERRERLQGLVEHRTGLRVPRRSSRGQSSSKSSQICAGGLLCAGHRECHTGQNPALPEPPALSRGRVRPRGLVLGLVVGPQPPRVSQQTYRSQGLLMAPASTAQCADPQGRPSALQTHPALCSNSPVPAWPPRTNPSEALCGSWGKVTSPSSLPEAQSWPAGSFPAIPPDLTSRPNQTPL